MLERNIQPIGRLNRYVLAEMILRERVVSEPACFVCGQVRSPLVPYRGQLLCLRDYELAQLRSTNSRASCLR